MSFREWTSSKLGDILTFNYGKGLPQKKRIFGDIPVYSSAGITGCHNEALVPQDGIIVGRKGTVGSVYYSSGPFFCIDTAYFITKDDTEQNLKYIYYLLKYLPLTKLNTDSAIPGLNRENAYSQQFNLPPLQEQKAIANILSTLDEKIEVNNQINKTLEEMAQAIFKQWFVDFEFPNGEGEPYKSSGGEMVKSEFGMIPRGWEVSRLENLCNITSSKRIFMNEYVSEGIPFYRGKEIIEKSKGTLISTELYISMDKYNEIKSKFSVPEKGDVLLTSVGTLGIPYKVDDEQFYFKDGNLTWFKDFVKNEYSNYIYLWLMSNEGRESLNSITIGSTQKALTIASLKNLKLIKSDELILEKFEGIISSLIDKIHYNNKEKSYLINLRDTLLPKLMSGEIRVPLNE